MAEIDKIIQGLRQKVVERENELLEAKKAVNSVCRMYRQREIYIIKGERESHSEELKGDEYYGKKLATVITEILLRRKAKGIGPASVREIYGQMKAGGYKFDAKDDQNAIRGVRIAMGKNTAKFHKLPTGKFGLKEWYPAAKEPPKTSKIPKKRGRPKKSEQAENKQGEPKE